MSPCFVLLLALPLVASQYMGSGRCPSPDVKANFSMDQFLGRWYPIMKMPRRNSENSGHRCSSSTFVRQMDNSVLLTITPHPKWTEGLIYEGREEAAKMELHVKIESESLNASMHTGEIWLLETDYTNMAVLYTCKDIFDMAYIEMAWVMSRERTLPSRMVGEALELLEGQGIDVSLMTRADHTDCDPLSESSESSEELEETTLS
ncbi:apolipoprotein D-like [Gadus macrocephalus]|uniref:apolipoprotein D-like n=1 Tax=Gadus macrocephalus TaxID=80720 RepID=UPI0028CB9F73|nr:apolipoprotein D-like [Gadus macrocephalus]